jgi:5-methylcytosine-specific restriction endonuclease McrA
MLSLHGAPDNFKNALLMQIEKHDAKQASMERRRREKEIQKKSGRMSLYRSPQWMALRKRVIKTYGRACMKCGCVTQSPHIDHIKPRARFPHLTFVFDNLQVLCAPCNQEKGATTADYRKR